jgi:hypothetical protein
VECVSPVRPSAATLWLPLRSPALAWGAALLATALYALSMARDLSFYDSGELALAAVQLGLPHPPGQPLFTLLGFAFAKLTWWSPLLGLNLLSALCGGLTLLPALSLAEGMLEQEREPLAKWVAPAALVVGSQHIALWEQATRVEVYALAVLLALWCLARAAYLLSGAGRGTRAWLGLGLGLGLCAAVNPVVCAFATLAGSAGLVEALRTRRTSARELAFALLGGVAGLLVYAYVPLVADRGAEALVWGAPSSPRALFDYLSGRDFRANLSVSLGRWLRQMVQWLAFGLEFALLPLWGVGIAAHALLPPPGLTRALVPVACLSSVAYLARYTRFIPEVPDYVSYTSLATWLCLIGCSALAAWLWARSMRVATVGLFCVLLATLAFGAPSPLARTRARERTARDMASELLASAPREALVIVGADHWVAPLWYLQEVERERTDVVVLATGLLGSSWYFEHLFQRHPELARAELKGPGGRQGRLGRLLARNAGRPLLFAEPALAHALGFTTCVHRFFAAANTPCSDDPREQTYAAALWERLGAAVGEGEPTALGVLASISYERGVWLAATGDLRAAVRTLLVPIDGALSDFDVEALPQGVVSVPQPTWQRAVPLGDPARNLYMAARLVMAAGAPKQGLLWMLAARDGGLPEAEAWLASVAPGAPTWR